MRADGTSGRPVQRVPLDELTDAAIAPVVSPLPTVMALVGAALSDTHRADVPAQVRRGLAAHLRRRDVAALWPLQTSHRSDGSGGRPNELVPLHQSASMSDELDAVSRVSVEELARGFAAAAAAGHPVGPWRQFEGAAARWLRAYVDALRRAWDVLEPIWARAASVLDREVERTSVALARGAGAQLVAQLYSHSAIVDDWLLLPSHSRGSGRARVGKALLLQPLLALPSSAGWTDDYGDVCLAVRYSVPGAWRVLEGQAPPPGSLAALIGPQRAKILLHLEQPATAGQLAELLHGAPSMVTHHLTAMERAGLIARTRKGRHVWVHRSARGTELVGLYEDR